ncbi:RQC domain-containing protein [Chryseomicrobium aureum]
MEEEVDVIEDYLARDENMTFHLLIQVLKGEATSKVRSLNLHTSPIFGLLRPWPKKLIPQAIKSFW